MGGFALLNSPMRTKQGLSEGLHRLTREERLSRVQEFCNLSSDEVEILSGKTQMPLAVAEHLIENVIGYFPIPLGVASHFVIDGKPLLIPMAVEETSIIAAASSTAKWIKKNGHIRTFSQGKLIIGQVQIPSVRNLQHATQQLTAERTALIDLANACVPGLVGRGGGIRDLLWREVPRPSEDGTMLVIHILCDPCDVMGANLINQVCEALKPRIEQVTGETVGLCILSNLVDTKVVGAEVVLKDVDPTLAHGIQEASLFAEADPYRATTHNKGVLNGIDPILIATGNDWRATEAGIHAYAARSGKYQPVTRWRAQGTELVGQIEVPMAVGIYGGVTRIHPTARVALKMLGVTQAEELARICAAVGLVQNLGALKALSTVGIVKGHMQLHTANLAIAAGAEVHEIAHVRERLNRVLQTEKSINLTHAREILVRLRESKNPSVPPSSAGVSGIIHA
jgi:hydroxymethylglutaryl-CoA reductase